MKPYFEDNLVTIYNKNCRKMSELPDNSVQCVVTSPPYWGLRKYSGLQDLIWNGWKGQYGLEPTPEMYIQHTIEILREIRRVLRKDGVVFWNIGDSYWSDTLSRKNPVEAIWGNRPASDLSSGRSNIPEANQRGGLGKRPEGLKPKDLCLIPFRVAIEAQRDGWWVRSVIIWSKPNPMPESVTDRPTESHEYILMLTKSARYYWDADAVREQGITGDVRRPYTSKGAWDIDGRPESQQHGGEPRENFTAGRNIRTVWEFPTQPYPEAHFAVFPEKLPEICIKAASKPSDIILDPFMGSGTTLWVAKILNRKAVGYELSEEYCQLALERNRQSVMELR